MQITNPKYEMAQSGRTRISLIKLTKLKEHIHTTGLLTLPVCSLSVHLYIQVDTHMCKWMYLIIWNTTTMAIQLLKSKNVVSHFRSKLGFLAITNQPTCWNSNFTQKIHSFSRTMLQNLESPHEFSCRNPNFMSFYRWESTMAEKHLSVTEHVSIFIFWKLVLRVCVELNSKSTFLFISVCIFYVFDCEIVMVRCTHIQFGAWLVGLERVTVTLEMSEF